MKGRITYSRKKIIVALRTLNELVVSLDRIGSASYDMSKAEHDAVLSDFIQGHKIFRKVAQARAILSEPFPTTIGPDDMSELEREMENVPYWKPRKKK